MNKSIIVVDTPDCCYHCKFNIIDGDVHDCYICHKKFERDNQMIRQEWCPLKPMPQKLDANDWHRMFGGEYKIREAKGNGYNACIDEILGGNE